MTNKSTTNNTGKTYKKTNKINLRAIAFKRFYIDVKSPTFCNIYQSAIKAGYAPEYAENISGRNPKWYQEMQADADFNRANMLRQAEKNISDTLKSVPDDSTDKKLKADASKFVAERVGKDKYSSRQELTDAGGKRLFNVKHVDDTQGALDDLFVGVAAEPDAIQSE